MGGTREPCPLLALAGGKPLLSADPPLVTDRNAYSGPARPEMLRFSVRAPTARFEIIVPVWDG